MSSLLEESHEARCIFCGNPAIDHLPLRYVLRAWLAHQIGRVMAWV